jgi:peptide/nickel transport system substrate-binding protein
VRFTPRSSIAIAAAVLGVAAAPGFGATLVVASEANPDSLDPALAYAPESWQVLVNAGEGLVAYRRSAGRAGAEIVPALAAQMPTVSADGRRLSFTLRADARFGPPTNRPVRASDVKASIERIFLARSPGRGLYRAIRGAAAFESAPAAVGIAGIVANDSTREVRISLVRSEPAILGALALPFAFVLPRGTPSSDQSEATTASAGPYRVAAYTPGGAIDLVRNPGYAPGQAGPAAPGPDAITVELGVSADDALRRLASGQVDYIQARPSPAEIRATAAGTGGRVWRHAEGATYYFFMNTTRPPFDDIRVRRAVNLAIDRMALARAFGGEAVPTAQVLPPGVPGRRPIDPAPAPDLERARALVARAGATGDAVSVWGPTGDPAPSATRLLEQALDRIGLRATPRLWERSTLLAQLADPAAPSQIGYARWQQDFPDGADWFPLLLAGSAIRTGSNLNYSLLDDPRVNALIAQTATTWDPAERAASWRAVGKAVAARAPWAPFANSVRSDLTSRRVGGYVGHQLYGFLWMSARLG